MLTELALFLMVVVLVTLFTAFLRVLATKWGTIEWGEVNLPKLLAKWISCNFCTAFWIAEFIGLCMFIATYGEVDLPGLYLLLGIFVAPISRLMA